MTAQAEAVERQRAEQPAVEQLQTQNSSLQRPQVLRSSRSWTI